jgi:hypothetical protein
MGKKGLGLALKFGDDSLSQHLTQLDAPLVERVKVPDHTLREDRVFVEGEVCRAFPAIVSSQSDWPLHVSRH